MKNFLQPGEIVDLPAPTGGVESGKPYKIGQLLGVAVKDAAQTVVTPFALVGVYELPKKAADNVSTVGALLYWDNAEGELTVTAAGNLLVGASVATAGATTTTVKIRLDGVSRAQIPS